MIMENMKSGANDFRVRCLASRVLPLMDILKSIGIHSVTYRSLVRLSPCDSCPTLEGSESLARRGYLKPGNTLLANVACGGWCHKTCFEDVFDDDASGAITDRLYAPDDTSVYCAGVALLKKREDLMVEIVCVVSDPIADLL